MDLQRRIKEMLKALSEMTPAERILFHLYMTLYYPEVLNGISKS